MPISAPLKKLPALLLAVALVAGAAGAGPRLCRGRGACGRGLAKLDGRHQRRGHGLAAARRARFRRVLPGLPLAEVRALVAARRRIWISRKQLLVKDLIPPGESPAGYITSPMIESDAEKWFGKAPPDLSLMARARGTDYLYQYLKTFYVDSDRATGRQQHGFPAKRHARYRRAARGAEDRGLQERRDSGRGRPDDQRAGLRPFQADRPRQHDAAAVRPVRARSS